MSEPLGLYCLLCLFAGVVIGLEAARWRQQRKEHQAFMRDMDRMWEELRGARVVQEEREEEA